MFKFRHKKSLENVKIDSKFHINDYVDFYYKDDVYFGVISDIYLLENRNVVYNIDIARQCPTTIEKIVESKVIRFHK